MFCGSFKLPGADPGFQVRRGGAHLIKSPRAEGGAKLFGLFRVKIHYDFFQFFSKLKFPILGGGGAGCPPLDPPLITSLVSSNFSYKYMIIFQTLLNHLCHVIASVLASIVIDRGFDPWSTSLAKDYDPLLSSSSLAD